ncbi:MAG: cytochrome C554, partial [Nitrosomonas sp.]|nr:cytochrome C554 [Nitrosomonas sp.]
MVKNTKAMHEHYKLEGVFEGEPKFKFHDEFQASAKPAKKGKE